MEDRGSQIGSECIFMFVLLFVYEHVLQLGVYVPFAVCECVNVCSVSLFTKAGLENPQEVVDGLLKKTASNSV